MTDRMGIHLLISIPGEEREGCEERAGRRREEEERRERKREGEERREGKGKELK